MVCVCVCVFLGMSRTCVRLRQSWAERGRGFVSAWRRSCSPPPSGSHGDSVSDTACTHCSPEHTHTHTHTHTSARTRTNTHMHTDVTCAIKISTLDSNSQPQAWEGGVLARRVNPM